MRKIITAMVMLITTGAHSEQLDPKQITSRVAEHYVKQLINIQHFNLGIQLPDQLAIKLKHSQYQFRHGGAITIKHRDPTHITYQYQRGDHSLEIDQDTIGYHFTKQFNWTR